MSGTFAPEYAYIPQDEFESNIVGKEQKQKPIPCWLLLINFDPNLRESLQSDLEF